MSTRILGYIVQIFDEEMLAPPMGGKHLFETFAEAMRHAKDIYHTYIEVNELDKDGLWEVYTPTKQHVDLSGGALVFRSREYHVWIDTILTS